MNDTFEKDYNKLLAYNLNRLAKQCDLTQQEIAAAVGMVPSSVNLYFLGKRFPNPNSLAVLADYFDVSISCLFKTPEEVEEDRNYIRGREPIRTGQIIGTTLEAPALENAIAKRRRNKLSGLFYVVVSSKEFAPYASVGEQLECTLDETVQPGCTVLACNGRNIGLYRAEEKDGGMVYIPAVGYSTISYKERNGFVVLCVVLAGRRPT